MAYTFQTVVNKILRAIGEVTLDSTAEFDDAIGIHAYTKDAVNTTIQDICASQNNKWDFQQQIADVVLSIGIQEYNFDNSVIDVDMYSFYIDYDAALDNKEAKELIFIPWQRYKKLYRISDLNTVLPANYKKPDFVTRTDLTSSKTFIVTPKPDAEYTVKWTQFVYPTELQNADDVPIIPQAYEGVLIEGTKYLMYDYKEDIESRDRAQQSYIKKLSDMTSALIQYSDVLVTDQ